MFSELFEGKISSSCFFSFFQTAKHPNTWISFFETSQSKDFKKQKHKIIVQNLIKTLKKRHFNFSLSKKVKKDGKSL